MKSIKKTLLLFVVLLSFSCIPLQAITQEDLIEFAIKNNDSELVDVLLKYGEKTNDPILNQAMRNKDYFTVFMLVEYGIDINSRSCLEGPFSISYNGIDKIILDNRTILEMALAAREISLVEYFLSKNADPTNSFNYMEEIPTYNNCDNEFFPAYKTAIFDAIILNRLEDLILFAQYDVDFNKICYSGFWGMGYFYYTPLQLAVAFRNKEVVNFLLSLGVEI